MSLIRFAFFASLTALAGVSLAGKARLPMDTAAAALSSDAAVLAVADLRADGWVPVGRISLTSDGLEEVRAFGSPRCDGAVMVVDLPSSGETASLTGRLAGADGMLLYLVGGGLTPDAPGPDSYVMAKLAPFLSRLGVPSAWLGATVPVAVVMLGTCADSALLPWDLALTIARPAEPSEPMPAPVAVNPGRPQQPV